jgi:hypothetical protein
MQCAMVGRTQVIAMNSKLQIIRLNYKIILFNLLTIVFQADFFNKMAGAHVCTFGILLFDPYIDLDCQ